MPCRCLRQGRDGAVTPGRARAGIAEVAAAGTAATQSQLRMLASRCRSSSRATQAATFWPAEAKSPDSLRYDAGRSGSSDSWSCRDASSVSSFSLLGQVQVLFLLGFSRHPKQPCPVSGVGRLPKRSEYSSVTPHFTNTIRCLASCLQTSHFSSLTYLHWLTSFRRSRFHTNIHFYVSRTR